MDANRDVFHFMNNDWYMQKRQKDSTDASQIGVWTFRYNIQLLYPSRFGRNIDPVKVWIDPAFNVTIEAPDCYPELVSCEDLTWTDFANEPAPETEP